MPSTHGGTALKVGELLRLAAAGDRAAWDALVERYEGLLWAIARSHRLDEASASDVVQTTWLRLVEHIDGLRNPDALAGWLATTARNECLRVLRHQSRQVPTEDDRMPADSVPPVDDARLLAARARRRAVARVRDAVGPLPGAAADAGGRARAELRGGRRRAGDGRR